MNISIKITESSEILEANNFLLKHSLKKPVLFTAVFSVIGLLAIMAGILDGPLKISGANYTTYYNLNIITSIGIGICIFGVMGLRTIIGAKKARERENTIRANQLLKSEQPVSIDIDEENLRYSSVGYSYSISWKLLNSYSFTPEYYIINQSAETYGPYIYKKGSFSKSEQIEFESFLKKTLIQKK
jgi:hypothetical protein